MDRPEPPHSRAPRGLFLVLALYALLIALYFVARYGGQWLETDTLAMTRSIYATQTQGTLTPSGATYQHGYLYQAISTAIADLTGLPVAQLQTLVYPFVSMLGVAACALMFYALVARDFRVAGLALFFLLLQPDALFVLLRGSHEKLDWPLMMTALSLLYLSLGQPARRLALLILLFYLVVFAQIATNVFFASTFFTAILISLALGLALQALLSRRAPPTYGDQHRLLYIALSVGILMFVSMVYLYPPALANLRLLRGIVEQIAALFLSFEVASQPYDYISFGWVSQPVYFGVSAFTWVLIVASMGVWARRGVRIFKGQEPLSLQHSLDWLLYAGFALQVGLSIVVDYSGALASNLQLRVFPGFTVLACVLLARAAWPWAARLRPATWKGALLAGVMLLAVAWFAPAALFKASNEPGLSNKWMFYSDDEVAALAWFNGRLSYAQIWTGIDERIRDAYHFTHLGQENDSNSLKAYTFSDDYRYVLFSENELLRASRVGLSMPAVMEWLRFYDNGNIQLYHRTPLTPFQR